jgi:SAM-dependent methyltransferase
MSNADQIEYWNGEAGERWAQQDEFMERLLQPVAQQLLDHAALEGCQSAIDVGCGGGSQSLMLAARLGPNARVLGVDISAPLLGVAKDRARATVGEVAALDFVQADASSHAFEANSFDLVFSRFGVMFFDDPVAAFSNIHSALRQPSRLAFSCWQGLQKNDWLWQPLQAALPFLPPPQKADPMAPGPFAFADPERVKEVLTASGFTNVALEPAAVTLCFDGAESLVDNVKGLVQVGPLSAMLADSDEQTRARVEAAVVDAMAPYDVNGALHLPGSVWLVTAEG